MDEEDSESTYESVTGISAKTPPAMVRRAMKMEEQADQRIFWVGVGLGVAALAFLFVPLRGPNQLQFSLFGLSMNVIGPPLGLALLIVALILVLRSKPKIGFK